MHKFSQDMSEKVFSNILAEVEPSEEEITSRRKTFFGGDESELCHENNNCLSNGNYQAFIYNLGTKPGMADYMIWPWGKKLGALKSIAGDKFVMPKERFPNWYLWQQIYSSSNLVVLLVILSLHYQ